MIRASSEGDHRSNAKFKVFFASFGLVLGLGAATAALAAVTISGTGITGDSNFTTISGSTSTAIDVGTNTLGLQTANGGPIQIGGITSSIVYATSSGQLVPLSIGTGLSVSSGTLSASGSASSSLSKASICSIESFNPAADGSTNDSAIFTTAASTCSEIMLTAGKSYAINTSTTISSAIKFTSGAKLVLGNGVILTLNGTIGAPVTQVFANATGTGGSVLFGPNVTVDYPEWWGGKADGSSGSTSGTDNQPYIQAAVSAMPKGGTVQLSDGYYLIGSGVTITGNHLWVAGATAPEEAPVGPRFGGTSGSVINQNFASGTALAFTGSGASCASNSVFNGGARDLIVATVVTPTSGAAVGITNGCWTKVEGVEAFNPYEGFYVNNSGNTLYRDDQASWTTTSASARYGFYVDSTGTGASNPGVTIDTSEVSATGVTTGANDYGLYMTGVNGSDLWTQNFQIAQLDYGIYFTASGGIDVHNDNIILDTCEKDCIYYGGNGALFEVNGGHIYNASSSGIGIDDESSALDVHGVEFIGNGSNTGIKFGNVSYCIIANNNFSAFGTGLTGSSGPAFCSITGNAFESPSANPATSFITLGTNSNGNIIANNQFTGFASAAVMDNGSNNANIIVGNAFGGTNLTHDIVTSGTRTGTVYGYPVNLFAATGPLTSVATGTLFGALVAPTRYTIDNLTASALSFSCTTNPTIAFYDCGTSATCSGAPTMLASTTLTGAGQAFAGTVISPGASSSIANGDYAGYEFTAGACSSLDVNLSAMAHMGPNR